jgi:aromatase
VNSHDGKVIHRHTVNAPPHQLQRLVADVAGWPALFEPVLHVGDPEHALVTGQLKLWTLVDGMPTHWTARIVRDDDAGLFSVHRQGELGQAREEWSFRPAGTGTEITLTQRFTPAGLARGQLAEQGARALATVDRVAGQGVAADELAFTFADTISVEGCSDTAYRFIAAAQRWPERLPHVRTVRLAEDEPNVQTMEMDTVTSDGSSHVTRSIRLCFPTTLIAYKQLTCPTLLAGHSGRWEFASIGGATVTTATHTVVIDPAAIDRVLGEGVGLTEARQHIRDVLGANSMATLTAATLPLADG